MSDKERGLRSAANKYRHMIPSTDAIEEENENGTKVGGSNLTGMFKRNDNMGEEDYSRAGSK